MKIIFVTPKVAQKILNDEVPSILDMLKNNEVKLMPTSDIYMNMIYGWTEDDCDNVAYIVDDEKYQKSDNVLKFVKG